MSQTERKKRTTIDDIAQAASVSKSTVSRVLTGSSRVTEEKREAVQKAIDQLNYQPNIFARGLSGGRSMTIGVVTQNVGSPFYDAVMAGIIAGFEGSTLSPLFADGRWQEDVQKSAIDTLLGRSVDGLIVVGGTIEAELLLQAEAQLPVLVVARDIPELEGRCIFVDNVQLAEDATRFLLDLGHRRIAHIAGDPAHQDAARRCEGYRQALAAAGLEPNEELICEGNFHQQSGVLAVETLLSRGQSFSAIFAANDQMAQGARLALYRRGIRVPDDVSLVGVDDQGGSAYMTPPLTTVRQPASEMGSAAAQAMTRLLAGKSVELPDFTSELIVRESTSRLR